MVTIIEMTGLAAATMPAAINCPEPAYSRSDISAISSRLKPAVRSTTPAAKPMLKYPSKVGIQSLTPAETSALPHPA